MRLSILARAFFIFLASSAVHAQDSRAQPFAGCVPVEEGKAFTLQIRNAEVKGVVLGQGTRGVVFSNTAVGNACGWLETARELARRGYQVALWSYGSAPGLHQTAELAAVIKELARRGATRVALVGGSRGGCLSMMASSEIGPPVSGVAILSCAAVFNRRDPVPTAPWAAKLRVPLLHITAENDPVPTLGEARSELASFPVADKKLMIVPKSGAHGDALLADLEDSAGVRRTLLEFIDRVTR